MAIKIADVKITTDLGNQTTYVGHNVSIEVEVMENNWLGVKNTFEDWQAIKDEFNSWMDLKYW